MTARYLNPTRSLVVWKAELEEHITTIRTSDTVEQVQGNMSSPIWSEYISGEWATENGLFSMIKPHCYVKGFETSACLTQVRGGVGDNLARYEHGYQCPDLDVAILLSNLPASPCTITLGDLWTFYVWQVAAWMYYHDEDQTAWATYLHRYYQTLHARQGDETHE